MVKDINFKTNQGSGRWQGNSSNDNESLRNQKKSSQKKKVLCKHSLSHFLLYFQPATGQISTFS